MEHLIERAIAAAQRAKSAYLAEVDNGTARSIHTTALFADAAQEEAEKAKRSATIAEAETCAKTAETWAWAAEHGHELRHSNAR